MTKHKVQANVELREPMQYALGIGTKATGYKPLTWKRACAVAEKTKSSDHRLHMGLTLLSWATPTSTQTIERVAEPCAPRAVANAQKRAHALVESGEAIAVWVSGDAEWSGGPRAGWGFGNFRRGAGGVGVGVSAARPASRRRR